MPAETVPVPAGTADVVEFRPKESRKDDGRAEADEAKRQGVGRRVVYAVEDLPDDVLAAILAAEPPAETARYDWELAAGDGAET